MRISAKIDGVRVSLVVINRSEFEYRERRGCRVRRLRLGGELLIDGIMVELYTIRTWDDGRVVTPEQRSRVARNIRRLAEIACRSIVVLGE